MPEVVLFIGERIGLDGQPEADALVDRFDGSVQAARERLRQLVWRKSVSDGVE